MPKFTAQHYTAIAEVLSEAREQASGEGGELKGTSATNGLLYVSDRLAKMFAEDNPNFDRSKFLNAAHPGY